MNYIKQIRIRNFRNLEDATFVIKPLTLLLGPNGSGKSTFMKSLLFLEKNLDNFDSHNIDYLYDISDDVKLGGYNDIVTNGDINKDVSFEFLINANDIQSDIDFSCNPFINVIYQFTNPEEDLGVIYTAISDRDSDLLLALNRVLGNPEVLYLNSIFTKVDIDKFNECYPELYDEFTKSEFYFNRITEFEEYNHGYVDGKRQLDFDPNDTKNQNNWESLSLEEKNRHYKNFRKLFFIKSYIYEILIVTIKEFLKIFRVPTVRTPIKNFYLLSDGKFSNNDNEEFYGLLRYFENEIFYNSADKGLKNKRIKEDYNFLIALRYCMSNKIDILALADLQILKNNRADTISKIKHVLLVESDETFSYGRFMCRGNLKNDFIRGELKNFLKYFENLSEKEFNKFVKTLKNSITLDLLFFYDLDKNIPYYVSNVELIKNYLDVDLPDFMPEMSFNMESLSNYWLNLLGFDIAVTIDKDKNIGVFNAYRVDYTKGIISEIPFNANYESSGFQQVYPIILFMAHIFLVLIEDFLDGNKISSNELNSLYIEQPELHMHPSLQTKLALLFCDFLDLYNQYNDGISPILYIETHSEHLIRSLQLMVAKNELSINDIAVNYLKQDGSSTNVKMLRFAENGNFIDPWPNGFFDEAVELSLELLKAQMNRNN